MRDGKHAAAPTIGARARAHARMLWPFKPAHLLVSLFLLQTCILRNTTGPMLR